jgi:hypothetical protein
MEFVKLTNIQRKYLKKYTKQVDDTRFLIFPFYVGFCKGVWIAQSV